MKPVTKTVFKVGDFVSWAQAGQLDLRPEFQRRSVWKSGAKSYLLDTVIRGLPIPIVFLRDRLSLHSLATSREVVDGQQRLRTLLSYINPSLLSDFDLARDGFRISSVHNSEYAGFGFSQLPKDVQQAIFGYEIPVHVFSADTEDRDILQIFARLNATGVKLNDQELRNAEFFGEFKTLTFSLAYQNLNRWQDWGVFKIGDIARMTEVEDVADLIVSMHEGVHAKNKATLDGYYRDYDVTYPQGPQVERRFEAVMHAIEMQIGSGLKATAFSRRALFNDLFVAMYELMFGLKSPLDVTKKPKKLPANFAATLVDLSNEIVDGVDLPQDVEASLRGATAHKGTRTARVNFILAPFGHAVPAS